MCEVFISYSHKDRSIADRICDILKELEIQFFRDEKNIDWGSSITDEVRDALKECLAILVVLSPASLKSSWVHYEIGHASALNLKILPFLSHDDVDIPLYIGSLNYISSYTAIKEYFSDVFPHEKSTVDIASERLVYLLYYLNSKRKYGFIGKEVIPKILESFKCEDCYEASKNQAWYSASDYALKYLRTLGLVKSNERQVKITTKGQKFLQSKNVRMDHPTIFSKEL